MAGFALGRLVGRDGPGMEKPPEHLGGLIGEERDRRQERGADLLGGAVGWRELQGVPTARDGPRQTAPQEAIPCADDDSMSNIQSVGNSRAPRAYLSLPAAGGACHLVCVRTSTTNPP